MDQKGIGRVALDFLAEAEDVDVDGAVGDGAVLAPYGVQQLLAAEDYPGTAHQKLQQAKLGGGECERHAIHANLAAGAVELNPAGFEHARRPRLIAKLELDPSNQLADGEGLDHVVVGADFQPDNTVRFRGARGQKDDGSGGQVRILADTFTDIEPVGVGQHDIEQDQIGPHLAAEFDGSATGLQSGEDKAFFFEVVLEECEQVRVVLDKNYFFHSRSRLPQVNSPPVTGPLKRCEFGIKTLATELGFAPRQREKERGAFIHAAFDARRSVVGGHQVLDDGKTQTGAA